MNNGGREYNFLNFIEERLKMVDNNKKNGYKKLRVKEDDTLKTIADRFEKYATGNNQENKNLYIELDGIYISSDECKTAERIIEKFEILQQIRTQFFNQHYEYDNKRVLSQHLFNGNSSRIKLNIISNIKEKYRPTILDEQINKKYTQQNNNQTDSIDIPIYFDEKKDIKQNSKEIMEYGMKNIDIPIEIENNDQTKNKNKTQEKVINKKEENYLIDNIDIPIRSENSNQGKLKPINKEMVYNQKRDNYVIDDIDIDIDFNNNENIKRNINSIQNKKEIRKYNYNNYYEEMFEELESKKQIDKREKNTEFNKEKIIDSLVDYAEFRHEKLTSKKEKLEFIINSDLKTLQNKSDELKNKIVEYDMSIEMYNNPENVKKIIVPEKRNKIKNIIENNTLKEIKEQERNLKEELDDFEFAIEKKKNDKMQYYHRKYGKVVDELSKLSKLKISKMDYLKYNTKIKIKNIMTYNLDLTNIKEMCKRTLFKNKSQEEIEESYKNGK